MGKHIMKAMLVLGVVAVAVAAGLAGLRIGSVIVAMAIIVVGLASLYGAVRVVRIEEMVSATGAAFGALICGIFGILALESGATVVGLASLGFAVVAAFWLGYLANSAVERWHDGQAK